MEAKGGGSSIASKGRKNVIIRLEAERTPSVRVTIDGKIEIWKGSNIIRLSWDEAQFIANMLTNIVK